MTGAEHFAEAEQFIESALNGEYVTPEQRQLHATVAQAHATLALAAAVERQNRLAHGTDAGGYGA